MSDKFQLKGAMATSSTNEAPLVGFCKVAIEGVYDYETLVEGQEDLLGLLEVIKEEEEQLDARLENVCYHIENTKTLSDLIFFIYNLYLSIQVR